LRIRSPAKDDSSPKYRSRIISPEKGLTELRLVRAVLVGFNQPLDVPKKAIHRSSIRSFFWTTTFSSTRGTCIEEVEWRKVTFGYDCISFLAAASDQDGLAVISMIERLHKSALF
jgi:hypothetical protein